MYEIHSHAVWVPVLTPAFMKIFHGNEFMICIYCWKSRINLIFWIRNSKFSSKILLKTWNGKSFSSQYSYFWNLDFMILLTWIHRIIYISWQFWKFMYEAPRIITVRLTSTFVKQLLANSQFNISFWMILCCWEQMMIENQITSNLHQRVWAIQ